MKTKLLIVLICCSVVGFAQKGAERASAKNNLAPVVEYGEPVTLEVSKKIANAALAFAVTNQWTVAIAIVDSGGNLVLFEKMENTQVGSIEVAIGKAKTANGFKRPTKAMEDGVASGGVGLRLLSIPGVFAIEGGEPIIVNGKIIGAIGVSGMKSTEDGEVVKAALATLR